MRTRIRDDGVGGFSLIEVLIASTVLLIVLGAVTMISEANNRACRTGITKAHLESQVGIVVQRMVAELVPADGDGLAVGADSVGYRKAVDYVNGQVLWSPDHLIAFEYELGEVDDGVDNNGNGLVDEGRVVLIEDQFGPNERRFVLTRWVSEHLEGEVFNGVDDNGNGLVDERGFSVEPMAGADAALVLRITLARRDEGGRLLRRTGQTTVRSRNGVGE